MDVLVCQRFGLSTFWFVDVSVCRRFGLSTFWFVDVSVCRRFGLSTFWLSTFRFVDVLTSYQQVNKPTRDTGETAALIGNIHCNHTTESEIAGLLYTNITDHYPIFISITNRLWNKGIQLTKDESIAKETLQNWLNLFEISIGQIYWIYWFWKKISDTYETSFPMREYVTSYKKPWLTEGIKMPLKGKTNYG